MSSGDLSSAHDNMDVEETSSDVPLAPSTESETTQLQNLSQQITSLQSTVSELVQQVTQLDADTTKRTMIETSVVRPSPTAATSPSEPRLLTKGPTPKKTYPDHDESHDMNPLHVPAAKFVKRRQVNSPLFSGRISVPTEISTIDGQQSRVFSEHNPDTGVVDYVPVDQYLLHEAREQLQPRLNTNSGPAQFPQRIPIADFLSPSDNAVAVIPSGNSETATTQVLVPQPVFSNQTSGTLTTLPHTHAALTAVISGLSLSRSTMTVPSTIKQALTGPDAHAWYQACQRELQAFKDHKTYRLVPLPPNRRALGTRWVLTIKGENMPKARLVAQGHRQIEGIDYTETFAPVARYDSVRVFLAISACLRLTVHQMDVNTAFLNSPTNDAVIVYVRQPLQFVDPAHPDYVWQLKGAMYGLKQAPLLWNQHIHTTLTKLGFRRHEGEYGLYFKRIPNGLVMVALYVDCLLIAAPNETIVGNVKRQLSRIYSMKDLGPVRKFLGMNVRQTPRSISITLADYISTAAASSEVPLHKQVHTPLSPSTDFQGEHSPLLEDITSYQAIVGQLLFIANTGRPDVAYSVGLLSRFLQAPRQVHLRAAHRVFQYLYTTRTHELVFRVGSPLQLTIYSDASHNSVTDIPYATREVL